MVPQLLIDLGKVLAALLVCCGTANLLASLLLGHLDTRRP